MIPGFGLKGIIFSIIALVVVTTVGFAYHHYTGLLETVRVLGENNEKLEIAHELQNQTIELQQLAIDDWYEAQDALIELVEEAQQRSYEAAAETRKLNEIFSRHDLTNLSQRKPGLIERRINSGTDDALRLLECTSGAGGEDCTTGTDTVTTGTSTDTEPATDQSETD